MCFHFLPFPDIDMTYIGEMIGRDIRSNSLSYIFNTTALDELVSPQYPSFSAPIKVNKQIPQHQRNVCRGQYMSLVIFVGCPHDVI